MTAPVERRFYSARAAAKYLGVGYTTVLNALRADGTDLDAPPPLEYDGRLGAGGKYQIPVAALDAWSKSLSRFG